MLEYKDMPRASTLKTEDSESMRVPKKRAPRKKAVTAVDIEGAEAKPRTPRKPRTNTAKSRSFNDADAAVVMSSEPARRAPTPLRANRERSKRFGRSLLVALVIFGVITGIGVVVGMSDGGEIDVVAVVNERNERVNRGEVREGESTMTVPVQSTDVRPNGGLAPADPSAIPVATPDDATNEATTTEAAATTTPPASDSQATNTPTIVDETSTEEPVDTTTEGGV